VIEEIGDRMDDVEANILEELPKMHIYAEGDLTMGVARDVHVLKRELFQIRRAFWPSREALSTMNSSQQPRLSAQGPHQYIKQAYDYTVNLIDNAETLRELGTNLVELYTAQLSLVMEKQMKILAMVDFVFLPLTFMTGVYGMVSPCRLRAMRASDTFHRQYPARLRNTTSCQPLPFAHI
jgi:magnesium transporter